MPISRPLRLVLLWLILIVCMILHFNYNVGKIFYGIEVARANAEGVVPFGTHLIRNIFYHLPLLWILILLFYHRASIRMGLFFISVIYTLSHAAHLVGELTQPDWSQGPLLSLTLLLSVVLSVEHYRYWRGGAALE
ncbi:MAG: hypothetical protein AAFW73_17855 [Bacteroidota bacterium]